MPAAAPTAPPRRLHSAGTLALLLLGAAGIAAAWALLALALDRQCAWMALPAALDALLMLRLAGMAPGLRRAALAVAGTALAIALANWWIAGAQMGQQVGLLPWYSIPRLGAHHLWTLVSLANGSMDTVLYTAGLAVAALGGFGLGPRRPAATARAG